MGTDDVTALDSQRGKAVQSWVTTRRLGPAMPPTENDPSDDERMTPQVIEAMRRKGMNQTEIAKHFGVTRQAVSKMKRTDGGYSETPREKVRNDFPWEVPTEHTAHHIYKRMRDHGEYMATDGRGMAEYKLDRLRRFYEEIESGNLVVEYDPFRQPSASARYPGKTTPGGFALVPRTNADGDLMVRVNQWTTITDVGRMLWRLPRRMPGSRQAG